MRDESARPANLRAMGREELQMFFDKGGIGFILREMWIAYCEPRHCSGVLRECLRQDSERPRRKERGAVLKPQSGVLRKSRWLKIRHRKNRRAAACPTQEESEREICRRWKLGCGGNGFLRRFAGLLQDFVFGADPIFQGVAWSAVALEIDFVGAQLDLLLRGKFFDGWGFAFRW